MNKHEPPRSFGVFKPTGHTIAAFPSLAQVDKAVAQLQATGLDSGGFTRFTPSEMLAQSDVDIDQASFFAAIGQELNLVKFHRKLALQGCHFLVVPTPDDVLASDFADVARICGALTAQHYGTLIITDLIDETGGRAQVFESPDRGLDSHPSS